MKIIDCNKCPLRETATQVVSGSGLFSNRYMIVGEAPGANEDEKGMPFIGRAGDMLNEALENAGLKRSMFYISNTVHCRPPENRKPTKEEIAACAIWLDAEIKRVNPEYILSLGETAMTRLLDVTGITTRRGHSHKSQYGNVFVSYHPSAALRSTKFKDIFMADISRFARLIKGEVRKRTKLTTESDSEKIKFVHLHVHDEFSILDGCGKVEDFIAEAQRLGCSSIAQTNHRNISGFPKFIKSCEQAGMKPILGCEMEIVDDMSQKDKEHRSGSHLTLWCANETGYKNLIKLVTASNVDGFYYNPRIDYTVLEAHKEGLIAGTACLGGVIAKKIRNNIDPKETIKRLQSFFKGRFFFEIMAIDVEGQKEINQELIKLGAYYNVPLLATVDAHYPTSDYAKVHEMLLMIQTASTIATPNRFKFDTNQLYLASPKEIKQRFETHGLSDKAIRFAMDNAAILDRMVDRITLSKLNVKDALPTPHGEHGSKVLRAIVATRWKRFAVKLNKTDWQKYNVRILHELSVIQAHGLSDYFLIATDMMDFCAEHGIRTGSRGSAAGSLVAFLLGISRVDPLKYGLMFERFLGPERLEAGSLPDVDLDIDHERRSELVEYITAKYGEDHVSSTCTFSRMRGKQVMKDVGRTQLIPLWEIQKATECIPSGKEEEDYEEVFSVLEDAEQKSPDFREFKAKHPKVVEAALKLEGQISHLSRHAAGFMISKHPITDMTPIIRVSNKFATGYEARDLERMGFTKFDLLGLHTLTIVELAMKYAKELGNDINIDDLPLEDKHVFAQFNAGHTKGIFQFDGFAVRLLKKWNSRTIDDLTAVNAGNRPGPLQSGMTDRIMKVRSGEDVEPNVLDDYLKETHGAMIYQEQVMQILREIGDMTFLDVDKVRGLIAKSKGIAAIEKYRSVFIEGALRKGYTKEKADQIFSFICEFGGYGFNKSHAAVYAYLAYQTMFLKVHRPAEFYAAYMTVHDSKDNIQEMIGEAIRAKVDIIYPNVETSQSGFVPLDSNTIQVGMSSIPFVGDKAAQAIIEARPFASYRDFVERVDLQLVNTRAVETLAAVGAFGFKGMNNRMIIEYHGSLLEQIKKNEAARKKAQAKGKPLPEKIKLNIKTIPEFTEDELFSNRSKILGLPMFLFELARYRDQLYKEGETRGMTPKKWRLAKGLIYELRSGDLVVVSVKAFREHVTKTGELMAFIKVEDETSEREVLLWPSAYQEKAALFTIGNIIAFRPDVEGDTLYINERTGIRILKENKIQEEADVEK